MHVPGTDAVILVANVAAGDPFGLTCKAWPANPDLLLVAVPLMRDQSEAEAADGHEGDLDVLVLERATLAAAPAPAEGADDGRRGGPDQPDVRYRPL